LQEGRLAQNKLACGCRDARLASDKLEMPRITHPHALKKVQMMTMKDILGGPYNVSRENSVEE